MKLNSVSFQSLFNKFLCKSQILQNGKGVRKDVYHGSEKCECISFCIDYILIFLAKKGDAPILFIFLTEIILNFLYDVTGMVQIECQGWNEYFFTSDVVKWKHFPHYCPFVRGIHRPLVILRKGPVIWIVYILFGVSLNKLLYKQWNGQWLKTLWRLWNVAVINEGVGICKTNDNKAVTATAFQFKQWPNDITTCNLSLVYTSVADSRRQSPGSATDADSRACVYTSAGDCRQRRWATVVSSRRL